MNIVRYSFVFIISLFLITFFPKFCVFATTPEYPNMLELVSHHFGFKYISVEILGEIDSYVGSESLSFSFDLIYVRGLYPLLFSFIELP